MVGEYISKKYSVELSGNDAEVTPVPIPNTEVKLRSADDTWWVTARESRSLLRLIQKRLDFVSNLFLFYVK